MPIDLSAWLTENEAANRLQVSVRTVRRMAARREIERRYRSVQGRRPEPVYRPDDVERKSAEIPFVSRPQASESSPLTPAVMPPHPSLLQAVSIFEKIAGPVLERTHQTIQAVMQALEEARRAPAAGVMARSERFKPWMTIKDASEYSGLTQGFLRRAVAKGEIYSVRDREGVKVRRSELDAFAGVLQMEVARPETEPASVPVTERNLKSDARGLQ